MVPGYYKRMVPGYHNKLKHRKKTAENKPVFDPNLHTELLIKDKIQDLGNMQY